MIKSESILALITPCHINKFFCHRVSDASHAKLFTCINLAFTIDKCSWCHTSSTFISKSCVNAHITRCAEVINVCTISTLLEFVQSKAIITYIAVLRCIGILLSTVFRASTVATTCFICEVAHSAFSTEIFACAFSTICTTCTTNFEVLVPVEPFITLRTDVIMTIFDQILWLILFTNSAVIDRFEYKARAVRLEEPSFLAFNTFEILINSEAACDCDFIAFAVHHL